MRPLFAAALALILLPLALACGGGDSGKGNTLLDNKPAAAGSPAPNATAPSATNPAVPAAPPDALDWQKAELDQSKLLPGTYVAPHPGPDGKLCIDRQCGTTSYDDRYHVNGVVPICTQQQLDSGNVSNPLCYTSNPPTSGPHSPTFPDFKIYTTPVSKEMLVHAMEHSAVVVWYNTTNQGVLNQMSQVVNGALADHRYVVMSPYPGMEPDTIALTAWTRLDKFPVSQFTQKRVLDFISAHSRRFNPEGF